MGNMSVYIQYPINIRLALEVGCLGLCPSSLLHCFEAPGLPKSTARQIRSEASELPFAAHTICSFE